MKSKDNPRVLRENLFMLSQIWRHAPGLLFAELAHSVLGAGNSALILVCNAAVLRLLGRGAPLAEFLPWLFLMGGSLLFCHLIVRFLTMYLRPKLTKTLDLRLSETLFQKASDCDLADFDNPVFYNEFDQAMRQAKRRATGTLQILSRVLRCVITFGTGCALILSVSPFLFLIALLGSVGELFIERRQVKIRAESDLAGTPSRRRAGYVRRVFFLSEYAEELRASPGYGDLLLRDFAAAEGEGMDIHLRAERRMWGWFLPAKGLREIERLISTLAVAAGYFHGGLNLADFLVTAANLGAVQTLLTTFGGLWNQCAENALYIVRLRKFLERQPKVKSGPLPPPAEFRTFEFRGVSFRYGEDENAPLRLRDLNLTIRRCEKIALVGENGAGKSTFVKLLLRFYDPTEGEILLNGVNVKRFDLPAYRQRIGALFQDFRLFPATIAENVLGGEAADAEFPRVRDALTAAGLWEKVQGLPGGVRCQVTKEFDPDGVQFSGGEGQKLALSRVFARAKGGVLFTVLDEPSSALDPLAEAAFNRAVTETLRVDTVIFISHRLTTTRDADRICLFSGGRIVEEGTHDALMARGGEYAALFRLQGVRYAGGTAPPPA